MSKKMFSRERERERGKLRFSALLILIGLLLFGCDPTMVTITYNPNGGKGEMKPQAVESGVEVKLNANTFTKDGSDFTGWNEAADGSGKAYADGATVTPTGNLTLYAQWQAKSTPENPGTEDPKPPVAKDNHITNLALIYVVEQAYADIGWTKTAEGYVDMTNETNKTLVEGVTSLGSDGDMFLNGIEYFTGLEELTLLNNSVLTKLPDLTSFSNLQRLTVTFTTESTADSSLTAVSGLPVSLEELDLSENKLTALDVSKLTDLKKLMVFNNELTELDITNNTQLTTLSCFNNRMTALDITKVEAFSQNPRPSTSILACGLQRNDSGLQDLTLTATQAQKTALASLFSEVTDDKNDPLNVFRLTNDGVVWDVPGAELDITAGTAVFNAASGLELPFTVVNTGALTEEKLTQLLTNATKKVTLFTADNETGTPVETRHISHGVDGSTPYISVAAAAFPLESTTYSKIEVVLEAEGYVTQTLTYTNVSVNPEQPGDGEIDVDLQLTAGTAVFNKITGLTLSFSGSTLPENASASVSLGGTEVNSEHVSFNSDRNAVVVTLAGLTNGASDMTVTVTVSAAGYNNAVLPYEGVSTVWIPDVTVTFDDTEKIGGESVSVTISPELSGVTIDSGTYSVVGENATKPLAINGDRLSFTAPILEGAAAKDAGTEVTISLVLAKANAESVTVDDGLTLKVYPSTHVRYDGRIFQQVKGFDFSTENTAKTAGVQIFKQKTAGVSNSWEQDSDWNEVQYISGEGYQFATTGSSGGMRFVFPETDGDLDFELIMVEAKWDNNSQANLHMSYWYEQKKTYGYSFYKTGQSFFMVGGYNFDAAYGFNADVTENTFNRFYAFDNGTNHSGRVNDGRVHSFTLSAPDSRTLDTLDKLQLEFSEKVDCTYTLKTVNFYKPLSN